MARSNAVGKLREIIEEEADPRAALLKSVGDIDFVPFHNLVLVAGHPGHKYHPGTKILRTDKDLIENRFQGTTGLVLKLGPLAFEDDNVAKFGGIKVKEGDWVLYRPSDGIELFIRQVPCRLFEDSHLKGGISDPTIYW